MLSEKELDELQIKTCKEMGSRIQDLIIRSDFTADELTELFGYGPKTIIRVINGTTVPNVNQLIELADALDTTPSYLLDGTVSSKLVIPKREDIYQMQNMYKRKVIDADLYIQFLEKKLLEVCNAK